MRKMNWLVGSIALVIGLVIGMVGYALAITPVDGDSRLMSFLGNKDAKAVTGSLQDSNTQTQDAQNPMTPDPNALGANSPLGTTGMNSESFPGSASGEGDLFTSGTTFPNSETLPNSQSNGVAAEIAQSIIADYKQDIGLFFEAWKSPEMVSFRSKLSKAYTGDLYEKHARQAESYIAQGVGIEISNIRFDQVNVESATSTAATLTAVYQYVAQDYDIGEQTPFGEKKNHQVKVRANLIKDNARWVITGETPIQ
jgi:hypothetical protein